MEKHRIGEYEVLFDPVNHHYFVDGNRVISVTQIIDHVLAKPYKNVDPEILKKAADRGTALHDMIEHYERYGQKTYHVEMRGYLALKAQHQIQVLENEKIVLLFRGGIPVAAGRFDMVVQSPYIKGLGIVDVKRMAHLHEDRLTLQLNLYKLGYEQTYKRRISYLKCMHIRNGYHDYVDVPKNRELVDKTLDAYFEKHPIDYTLYQ